MEHKHLIVDLTNCQNTAVLENLRDLQDSMAVVASACSLHVVGEAGHQFLPTGASNVLLLSESHFSVHTWAEEHQAHCDIFCCNPGFDAEAAVKLLCVAFDTRQAEWTVKARLRVTPVEAGPRDV